MYSYLFIQNKIIRIRIRIRNRTSLVPSRSKTVKLGRRLMDTAAATLWNTLPEGIKCSPSVTIFKKTLKDISF